MQKTWIYQHPNPKLQAKLSDALGVHPIVAQLLINRGITSVDEARSFLSCDLTAAHDPFLFKNMDKVVGRLKQAQERKERVLVFGDYDVDGVTSSVLLHNYLTSIGVDVVNHIPDRMQDGYGLNKDVGHFAKAEGVSLIVTIDCGITAVEEVEHLNEMGFDVIIVDHHEPSEALPPALAIIDPKQKDCRYPFKQLASVGLAVKLIQAMHGSIREEDLDLAAIGTIADIVPLRDENRMFVKAGLPLVAKTKNKGLRALLDMAKITGKPVSPYYVSFILGPRINATGRMGSAKASLDLFLCDDHGEAHALARVLEQTNTKRQRMQQDVIQEAIDLIEQEVNFKDQKVIVLSKEGWHKGVLGIVASKITEKYYRPSVVISVENGVGTASARSIEGFHLHEVLEQCAGHLVTFGGHQGAAGLTIREEEIDPFRVLINEIAHKTLEVKKLTPTLAVDCEIPIASVTMELAHIIDSMEPFGEGNPVPVFSSRDAVVKGYPVVMGKDTIKFWVTDGGHAVSVIGFGMAKYKPLLKPGERVHLAYNITIDDWNKAPQVQLKLKDLNTDT